MWKYNWAIEIMRDSRKGKGSMVLLAGCMDWSRCGKIGIS